jgi:glycine cleavage system H protein
MAELKFHREHAWIKLVGNMGIIGISDFAQHQLGKIIYVELPEEGQEITAGEPFGAIESSKSTSDLIAPATGEVLESNGDLDDKPNLINESPYDQGWIAKIKLSDPTELEGLMDEPGYKEMTASEREK